MWGFACTFEKLDHFLPLGAHCLVTVSASKTMPSFFTLPASQRKRKRADDRAGKPTKRRGLNSGEGPDGQAPRRNALSRERQRKDDSISGSEAEDELEPETTDDDDEEEEEEESEATSEEGETAAERRVRLAERYLDNIRQELDETGFDAEDLDKDLIAQRLKEDVDEAKGRQYRLIASTLDFTNAAHCSFRADTETTTAVAICPPYVYTVSKDKTLIKWQLQNPSIPPQANGSSPSRPGPRRRKPRQIAYVRGVKARASATQQHGHTGAILSVAASPDGKYVATGGADKKLIIWSAADLRPLKTFTTHRDSVTGLSFPPSSSSQSGFGTQLFSASADRSVKTYNLAGEDSLAYVETLFGHQDHVVAVSAMAMDQCVTVGARDRTARLWRVVEEEQLKFLGDSSRNEQYQTGSLDCVAALPPQHFVTGSDSGAISLWSIHKKKALFTVQTAHGVDEPPRLEEVTSESDPNVIDRLKKDDHRRPIPRAITALASLPGTNVVLSGSWDGWVRVWKVSDDKRSLIALGVIGHDQHRGENSDRHLSGETDSLGRGPTSAHSTIGPVRGVINSLAVFERRKEKRAEFGGKKEGEGQGLCVIAGTGKQMRLGNWIKFPHGRNGAIMFEVPLLGQPGQ